MLPVGESESGDSVAHHPPLDSAMDWMPAAIARLTQWGIDCSIDIQAESGKFSPDCVANCWAVLGIHSQEEGTDGSKVVKGGGLLP